MIQKHFKKKINTISRDYLFKINKNKEIDKILEPKEKLKGRKI